jgi:hypothetical protein
MSEVGLGAWDKFELDLVAVSPFQEFASKKDHSLYSHSTFSKNRSQSF